VEINTEAIDSPKPVSGMTSVGEENTETLKVKSWKL
jgi:hypothetical protein